MFLHHAGRRAFALLVLGATLTAAWLVASRLLGLVAAPDLAIALGAPAVLAFLAAGLTTRRSSPDAVARALDRASGGDDLLLTAVQVGRQSSTGTASAYEPLVLARAQERAARVSAAAAVPLGGARKAFGIALAFAALAVFALYAPQLDPFGAHQERTKTDALTKRIEEQRKALAQRAAELAKTPVDAPNSAAVAAELEKIAATFKQPPAEPKELVAKLAQHQQDANAKWREVNAKLLAQALDRASLSQRLGETADEKTAQMRDALSRGDAAPMAAELGALQELAKQLASATDESQKAALKKQLKKRLEAMKKSLGSAANSPLRQALSQALDSLEDPAAAGLSHEQLEALGEALYLSERELAQVAQLIRDEKALEEAIKAIQQAKRLVASLEKVKQEAAKAGDKTSPEEKAKLERVDLFARELARRQLQLAALSMGKPGASEQIEKATRLAENLAQKLEQVQKRQQELAQASGSDGSGSGQGSGSGSDAAQTAEERAKQRAQMEGELAKQLDELARLAAQMQACSGAG